MLCILEDEVERWSCRKEIIPQAKGYICNLLADEGLWLAKIDLVVQHG